MFGLLGRYTKWLHTQWPAGVGEKLPRVNEDFSTNVPGLYITGDLTGIPLLKFSSDSGARAVRTIASDPAFKLIRASHESGESDILDLLIVGAGVSGMAAALEAEKQGLHYQILEAAEAFSTIVNFPRAKPIFTYPTEMIPAGDLQFSADVKEPLLDDLREQTRRIKPRAVRVEKVLRKGKVLEALVAGEECILTHRVIVAIGRSGNFRKLGIPGEELEKVFNRLHDPKDFAGKSVVVVGGGDSALETSIALAQAGANVTVSYRRKEFSRPKPENVERLEILRADPMADVEIETPVSERVTTATGGFMSAHKRPGSIALMMGSKPKAIAGDSMTIADAEGEEQSIDNDAVLVMIGREAPLDFFRRSGVRITGETVGVEWAFIALFFVAIFLFYDWKNEGVVSHQISALGQAEFFPQNVPSVIGGWSEAWSERVADRSTIVGTLAVSMKSRSFYYTALYTLAIGVFGFLRVRRRKTPYVKLQTLSLFSVQFIPLFILPEFILPWLGYNGWFDAGLGAGFANAFFEPYISAAAYAAHDWPSWGHPRAYWHAYGFILAWPLSVYNVFTAAPLWGWLTVSFVQTFMIIPALVYFYGKGAYCGWICSCGGLAETMGDTQRHKMPHGAKWNRLNMLGQALLLAAFVLLGVRIIGWAMPGSWADRTFMFMIEGKNASGMTVNYASWKWIVDVGLGGVIGVGLYFKYSGRVWCRFACPLAALMNIYARFSRFRIIAEKKKCISCNVCTNICHQGIDIMNFANKGMPMADPQCVRCSACVMACPTGVLRFGQIDRRTGAVLKYDKLAASGIQMSEAALENEGTR